MTAAPPHQGFAWLRDPRHRRGALELVRRAVRTDWPIPEADRAALVAELSGLLESDTLSTRETMAVGRILAEMTAANARAGPGARPHRPGRRHGATFEAGGGTCSSGSKRVRR